MVSIRCMTVNGFLVEFHPHKLIYPNILLWRGYAAFVYTVYNTNCNLQPHIINRCERSFFFFFFSRFRFSFSFSIFSQTRAKCLWISYERAHAPILLFTKIIEKFAQS